MAERWPPRQLDSDEHWDCFKDNVGNLLRNGRVAGAHMGVSQRIDTTLTEHTQTVQKYSDTHERAHSHSSVYITNT